MAESADPKAVLSRARETAAKAVYQLDPYLPPHTKGEEPEPYTWDGATDGIRDLYRKHANAAIAAYEAEISKELVLVPREMPTTFEEVLPQVIAAQLAIKPNAPEEVITELQDRFNEALGKAVASLAAPGAAGEEGKEG
jgi:hypothetical protein